MGGDMMTARGPAAVDGRTLFGHNASAPFDVPFRLEQTAGGTHAPEERVRATFIEVPQNPADLCGPRRPNRQRLGLCPRRQSAGRGGRLHESAQRACALTLPV